MRLSKTVSFSIKRLRAKAAPMLQLSHTHSSRPTCQSTSSKRRLFHFFLAKYRLPCLTIATLLSDINSLDFVLNQFFMKLFCTSDINIVYDCQLLFNFKTCSTVCDVWSGYFVNSLFLCIFFFFSLFATVSGDCKMYVGSEHAGTTFSPVWLH